MIVDYFGMELKVIGIIPEKFSCKSVIVDYFGIELEVANLASCLRILR